MQYIKLHKHTYIILWNCPLEFESQHHQYSTIWTENAIYVFIFVKWYNTRRADQSKVVTDPQTMQWSDREKQPSIIIVQREILQSMSFQKKNTWHLIVFVFATCCVKTMTWFSHNMLQIPNDGVVSEIVTMSSKIYRIKKETHTVRFSH